MLKLLGNNSGKNNKSCSIFHLKSNKIQIAFLRFFYDFLRNLQESAKLVYYLRITFATRPLTVLDSLRIGPCVCNQDPGKNGEDAIGSPGVAGGGSGKNPASRRRGGRGKGGDVTMNSPRVDLRSKTGRGWRWRAPSTAPGGGGHRELVSCEVAVGL
jgi:hypothetical protein